MQEEGFYYGPIDGIYGPITRRAVLEFQRENELISDGVVGANTWDEMDSGGIIGDEPGLIDEDESIVDDDAPMFDDPPGVFDDDAPIFNDESGLIN